MPDSAAHIAQAATNEALSQQLETSYPEWAVTALFYAALHYVQAYFFDNAASMQPQHYLTHGRRDQGVAQRLQSLHGGYLTLEDASQDARYECMVFATVDVQELRGDHLVPIKQYILARSHAPPAAP